MAKEQSMSRFGGGGVGRRILGLFLNTSTGGSLLKREQFELEMRFEEPCGQRHSSLKKL